MQWLLELVAPRTKGSAVLRGVVLIVLMNMVNHLVWLHLRADTYLPLREILHSTAVAIPFVGVIMAALLHLSRLKERLAVLAETDMLTGLLNRRAFLERSRRMVEDGQAAALLLLDADHFKRINDSLGHAAGDECLLAIGDLIRQHAGRDDVLGRIGGEEFALCLVADQGEVDRLHLIGPSLCAGVTIPGNDRVDHQHVTLSAGAVRCRSGEAVDRLMARADRALYIAKARGRSQMVMVTDGPTSLPVAGCPGLRDPEAEPAAPALRDGQPPDDLASDMSCSMASVATIAREIRPSA